MYPNHIFQVKKKTKSLPPKKNTIGISRDGFEFGNFSFWWKHLTLCH
jgi:hypothetical protein